ncbi:hypothetical protein [Paracoccus homiensis]|uniref:Uncharacterized protein n=1 Tax=Paracoccus homiensis TaxID=364199 RepID=A0A1H9YCP7_9RHOB|nr:hypothetical protein [Paracoccus homiensis]SES66722.1 hypothetical protein SAMN04489858_101121 [Paracoccus homiensis]
MDADKEYGKVHSTEPSKPEGEYGDKRRQLDKDNSASERMGDEGSPPKQDKAPDKPLK